MEREKNRSDRRKKGGISERDGGQGVFDFAKKRFKYFLFGGAIALKDNFTPEGRG